MSNRNKIATDTIDQYYPNRKYTAIVFASANHSRMYHRQGPRMFLIYQHILTLLLIAWPLLLHLCALSCRTSLKSHKTDIIRNTRGTSNEQKISYKNR